MTTQAWNCNDGNQYREMVDGAGRSVSTHVHEGDLIKAIPGGTWVGELRRTHPEWTCVPHVTTVEALGSLLGEIGTVKNAPYCGALCDGWCGDVTERRNCLKGESK